MRRFSLGQDNIISAKLSCDSRHLLTEDGAWRIKMSDLTLGKEVMRFPNDANMPSLACAISKSGKYVSIMNQTGLTVWSTTAPKKPMAVFPLSIFGSRELTRLMYDLNEMKGLWIPGQYLRLDFFEKHRLVLAFQTETKQWTWSIDINKQSIEKAPPFRVKPQLDRKPGGHKSNKEPQPHRRQNTRKCIFPTYSADGAYYANSQNIGHASPRVPVCLISIFDSSQSVSRQTIVRSQITAAALTSSPNSSLLMTGSDTGEIQSWNFKTGYRIGGSLKHNKSICCISFNSTANCVLTASEDGMVKLWPIGNSACHNTPVRIDFFAKDMPVPDKYIRGKAKPTVSLKSLDSGGSVVLNAISGEQILTLKQDSQTLAALCSSPDKKRIFIITKQGDMSLWVPSTNKRILSLGNIVPIILKNTPYVKGHSIYSDSIIQRMLESQSKYYLYKFNSAGFSDDGKVLYVVCELTSTANRGKYVIEFIASDWKL